MQLAQVALIVVISGLIGYITNVLAIKSLFRPLTEKKIGPLKIQGLIPKRQGEIAENIGQMVANDLLSQDDLVSQVISDKDEGRFKEILTQRVQQVLVDKTSFLPQVFQDKLLLALEDKLDRESPKIFAEVKDLAEDHIRRKMDIAGLIEEKIKGLDLVKLEELTLKIASRELKAIEWLGLVMGAAIGLIQGLLTVYLF